MKSLPPKICCSAMAFILNDEDSNFHYHELNFMIKHEKYSSGFFKKRISWGTTYLSYCPFCGLELKKLVN